jgi:hypothetical protein
VYNDQQDALLWYSEDCVGSFGELVSVLSYHEEYIKKCSSSAEKVHLYDEDYFMYFKCTV